MDLQLTITVKVQDNIFNSNKPDEVIWFLEEVLNKDNLELGSKLLNDKLGDIDKIEDIIEI